MLNKIAGHKCPVCGHNEAIVNGVNVSGQYAECSCFKCERSFRLGFTWNLNAEICDVVNYG